MRPLLERWAGGLLVVCLALVLLVAVSHVHQRQWRHEQPPEKAARTVGNDTLVFVQYQGPPALSLSPKGQWQGTESHTYLCQSLLSAAYHNVRPVVLGPVPGVDPKFGKVDALAKFLRHGNLTEGSIVIFYDTDILFLHDVSGVAAALQTLPLEAAVVFSAERNAWPLALPRYPPVPTSFRYPNTGLVAGRVGPLLRAIVDGWQRCVTDEVDDQLCIHWFYARHRRGGRYLPRRFMRVALDAHCGLLQNVYRTGLQHFDNDSARLAWVRDGRVYNPETRLCPALIHFNGARDQMRPFWDAFYPALAWDHPKVRDVEFDIWQRQVPGRQLCDPTVIRTSPAATHRLTKPIDGPPVSKIVRVWWFVLDLPEMLFHLIR